jgi:DNA-binding transcriptional MerR regulator
MSKAADAFRTISEVAAELDVPKHVLRFWEAKFAQIRPMKRGGGRRYYRPADMELLRGIQHLLHAEGYTIKGVQKILREQGIDTVKMFSHAGPAAALAASGPRKGTRASSEVGAVGGAKLSAKPAREPPAVVTVTARQGHAADRGSIAAIIRELELCKRLLENAGKTVEAERAPRRARAGSA